MNTTTTCRFNGEFDVNCQRESVSESLKTFVGMILCTPDIKTQSSGMIETQTTLSISQQILFNSTKRRRNSDTRPSRYHSTDREPPLPVYLGLMSHAETRKRALVDELYSLGLSISYDRVLENSTEMGNKVCARYESEGVLCPPELKKNVFTTAAVAWTILITIPALRLHKGPSMAQEYRYFNTRLMQLVKIETL